MSLECRNEECTLLMTCGLCADKTLKYCEKRLDPDAEFAASAPVDSQSAGSVRGSLECPECGEICQPSKENADGGFSYHCHNLKGHGLGKCLNFRIDKKGEIHF